MESCLEEISSTVLDAGEPISYRTLSIRSQLPISVSTEALAQFAADNESVQVLQLLIKRMAVDNDDNESETAAAKRDPRARVLSLAPGCVEKTEDLHRQQVYALYNKTNPEADDAVQKAVVATTCWVQERQARNQVLGSVAKHDLLSAAAKALYASNIKCSEATTRQSVGDQGEETSSAFDALNASATKRPSLPASIFKKNDNTGSIKTSCSSKNGGDTTKHPPQSKKLNMSNVLTVDSDDDEDDETDAPVFVKKSTTNKRIISDDEDEEEERVTLQKSGNRVPKSRNVKRKLNASPAGTKKVTSTEEVEEEARTKQRAESEGEDDEAAEEPVVATKRQVLVSKTRINEQGYMVTEKSYQEVELTPEEIEEEQKARKKKGEERKKKAAAQKVANAKNEATKQSGSSKQRDLRSFFSAK